MMAYMAFLAGVSRVDVDHRNPSNSCLIFDKLFDLIESPRKMFAPPGLPTRRPLPHAFEIFKGNHSRGVFSLRNHLFRDAMI